MITARLSDDERWIYIEGTKHELNQIKLSFTKKIDSWFIIKSKCPTAKVDECFINHLNFIPAGLWLELVNVCLAFNFKITFLDDFDSKIKNNSVNKGTFDNYINNLFKESEKIKPRDYQMNGVFNVLLYKNCCIEVSTSGGKTLMSYMMFKYMNEVLNIKHILFITPKTNLTTQSAEKFVLYDRENNVETNWTYSEIHGKSKHQDEYNENIVFGNYQSLRNKNQDFFDKFDAVIIDECHHSSASSIKTIIRKLNNVKYKIGMTGTFPQNESYRSFILQSYIGPVVYRLTSKELIDEKKSATPVHVYMFYMKYLDDITLKELHKARSVNKSDNPTLGTTLLRQERDVARDSEKRLNYICDIVKKTTKNSLVIFSDIQNEYGVSIYENIKNSSNKNVQYIDGRTSTKIRDEIKQIMEDDMTGSTVIVASVGCFSEGIDICNLWNIFLVETTKSETTLAQILGRGMRSFKGKDKTTMIDFVDDFRYGNNQYRDNYLYKHGKEREKIYMKRGFPCKMFEVDI